MQTLFSSTAFHSQKLDQKTFKLSIKLRSGFITNNDKPRLALVGAFYQQSRIAAVFTSLRCL